MLNLVEAVSAEYVIRQSRFVVHAGPVANQAETLEFYDKHADPGASHNCWAWKLEQTHRFNDDGEPASTAGKPILAAIEGKKLGQVMVIVTRYFGGIKLGVGGLVRAYGGCASRCLDQAQVHEHHPVCQCLIEADFAYTGALHTALESCEATKTDETFVADGLQLQIEVRLDRLRKLQSLLRDGTRGSARIRRL